MSYTVKLAIFPPCNAPLPYETLAEAFSTTADAFRAAEKVLLPITQRELMGLAPYFRPGPEQIDGQKVTAVTVPDREVHGFLIYDAEGVEVCNWTTLDVAVEQADKG